MKKRNYTAADARGVDRCEADITLRDGSGARCMRAAKIDGLCAQHAKMTAEFSCEYCGGNDERPPSHCMDCTRLGAAN